VGAGTNAQEPDLMPYGSDGFILAFVRDFWFPGLREVCYQIYSGGWGTPVGIYFGVYVNSPTVAWDGDNTALLAFVLDNLGTAPLLHTCRIDGGTAEPVRWRLGEPLISHTVVAAAGDESFWLLTQETESGIPMNVNLRSGDGHVFFPKRKLNNNVGDVDIPYLGARMGGEGVYAMWSDFSSINYTHGWYACNIAPPSPVPEADAGLLALRALPNPFNPQTVLEFGLARPGPVKLAVFDLRGQKVRTLLNEVLDAGDHQVGFDGRDDEGRRLASGVFFARLELPGGQGEMVTKLVLVK
jgi:hypothetical protein